MTGRCKACDAVLDEFEMVRKYPGTTEYVELCDYCSRLGELEDDFLDDIDVSLISIDELEEP